MKNLQAENKSLKTKIKEMETEIKGFKSENYDLKYKVLKISKLTSKWELSDNFSQKPANKIFKL